MKIPESIRKFADFFSQLPGIGPRQAIRLGFYLAERGEGARGEAEKAIASLAEVKICIRCFYVHDTKGELCEICSDKSRDQGLVAIIEKETDLMSLENIGKYKGVYLVIGDIRKKSILEPGQKLRLQSLKARLKELPSGKAKEIIIAVNPTSVGNINAEAISDELKGSAEKITRLGIGIPSGGEIEFADAETLGGAIGEKGLDLSIGLTSDNPWLYLWYMNEENKETEATKPTEASQSQSELEKLKTERDEYLNGWKRAKADLINYQKEEGRRAAETVKYGNEKILLEVIRILDSFSLALSVLEKTGGADKGLHLIRSQMEDMLKRNGVERIVITAGETLDTNKHEAVVMVDPSGEMKSDMVTEELETGYMLNGKVLRPTKVKVVK